MSRIASVIGQPVFNIGAFDVRTCQNGGTSCNNTPTSGAFNPNIQPTANNYRTFPQYLLRQDYTSNWDSNLQKNTKLAEGVTMELRIDMFNMLNRPQYNTPNVSPTSAAFGTTSGVYSGSGSRQIQLGAHFIW